jgi:hypothetical protein
MRPAHPKGPEKNAENPVFAGRPIDWSGCGTRAADPNEPVIRVEHVTHPGSKWTLLRNWFVSPTLVWRERMPRWQVPGVALASTRELREWA